MTTNEIMNALEAGKKITLNEYERLVRRQRKLVLELDRLSNTLGGVLDLPGHVVLDDELPSDISQRPEAGS